MKYDYAVYVGRFQPLHNGHLSVAQKGLEIAQNLIVLVGSSDQPRTSSNPWTFEEREQMIRASLPSDRLIFVAPVLDYPYDDPRWVDETRKAVQRLADGSAKIAVIGRDKNGAGYWLTAFREWDFVDVGYVGTASATDIRDDMLLERGFDRNVVPEPVQKFLTLFATTNPAFWDLVEEAKHVAAYKKSWSGSPLPPTFNVADAVVTWGVYVLLIQRGRAPGRGLWALPGGFIEQRERLFDAALRELREETGLYLAPGDNVAALRDFMVFDHPDRSARGRLISQAFHFDVTKLFPGAGPPPVMGADDAQLADWVEVKALQRSVLFADHWHILNHFLNLEGATA